VLVTSRPEVPIRYGFCQISEPKHRDFILHNIEAAIVDYDFSIFLDYETRSIRQELALGAGWLGEQALKTASSKRQWPLHLGCNFLSVYPGGKSIRSEETVDDARRHI
jgi:hypothetical protein